MQIYFILVEPQVPENIGASARAVKTMGFQHLRLVKPINHLDEKARWLAHGSIDILRNAVIFDSFEESISDLDFVIGTTSKRRRVKYDYYTSDYIPELISNKKNAVLKVGIIFGREDKGLLNKELELCDILSFIPMKKQYPSVNLAQSVMIYAYSFYLFKSKKEQSLEINAAKTAKYYSFKEEVKKILKTINIFPDSNIYTRIMERLAIIGDGDINLIYSICNELSKNLNYSDSD